VQTATEAEGRAADVSAVSRSKHLWQIDVVRLLTFTAVIAVHSLAFTEQPDNRLAAGAMMLLQFGREVFFGLTGFVLVYTAWDRTPKAGKFWLRRISYVAIPYAVWTSIYYAYSVLGPQHLNPSWSVFGLDLLDGGAMYHLYFLLVTMQLYLLFPLLLAFVRRTSERAWAVLGMVAAANLVWLAVLQYVPAPGGTAGWFWDHAYELLPTYAMYVLAGCYAAAYLPKLQQVVNRRPRALALVAALCGAIAVGVYAVQLEYMAPRSAANVLQPATLFSCLCAAILLYLLGSRWASGPRRSVATIALLSDASFGVYLAHPLVLQLLLDHGLGNSGQAIPAAAATILGILAAAAGGLAIVLAARRTPLSLLLTGRPRKSGAPRTVSSTVSSAVPGTRLTGAGRPALARYPLSASFSRASTSPDDVLATSPSPPRPRLDLTLAVGLEQGATKL
jgi:peptidoglycan/LPS O-acetylase OafA/YrhL